MSDNTIHVCVYVYVSVLWCAWVFVCERNRQKTETRKNVYMFMCKYNGTHSSKASEVCMCVLGRVTLICINLFNSQIVGTHLPCGDKMKVPIM